MISMRSSYTESGKSFLKILILRLTNSYFPKAISGLSKTSTAAHSPATLSGWQDCAEFFRQLSVLKKAKARTKLDSKINPLASFAIQYLTKFEKMQEGEYVSTGSD